MSHSPPPGDAETAVARGRAAEDLALAFLKKNGLVLLTRNYHCRGGEIDLVMRDGEAVVFVEVRLRGSLESAAESITAAKRRKLTTAARRFLQQEIGDAGAEWTLRFDAALVDGAKKIRWLRDTMRLENGEW